MPFSHRTRVANPHLGVYFGIFMSGFVALSLLALIFEGLGTGEGVRRVLMLVGPVLLYAGIGIASHNKSVLDFFACGRRVPAFHTGLGLAITAMGATGVLGLSGAFFLIGFDALCLAIGGLAGFVVMAIMLAPFFRKFGAFTVPSYLGRRFDSRVLRLSAGALLAVPVILLLAAEIRVGSYAAAQLSGIKAEFLTAFIVLVLVATLVAGGVRSFTWSSSAEGMASLIAILVPVSIVAVMLTNFPIAQLSHGPTLRAVGRAEAGLGLPIILPPMLAFDFPGEELAPVAKRFSDALGSVGPLAFVIIMMTTLCGVASAPWLLPRVAATPSVYEARKSIGWATVLFGILMLTLSSAAVFMRDYLVEIFTVTGPARIPPWITELASIGSVQVSAAEGNLTLGSFLFARDGVLLGLPVAAGLPAATGYLLTAGVMAIALAAAGATANALGNIISEDLLNGLSWEPVADHLRLNLARAGLVVAAVLGAVVALIAPTDPMELMLWSLSLTGATSFPVLVLSIWWKRLNSFGALAGMATGFTVTITAILASASGLTDLPAALAGIFGIPAAWTAAIAVAAVTPPPSKHVYELVRDIRVPGGEILYDREMRIARRKKSQRP